MNSASRFLQLTLLALSLGAVGVPPAAAGDRLGVALASQPDTDDSTDRLIVKLRDPVMRDSHRRVAEVAGRAGEQLQHLRFMSGGAHVVKMSRRMSRTEAAAVARRLASDPAVAYVEPDLQVRPLRVPNDASYPRQWDFFEAAGGINLPGAWDITIGSSAVTAAVLDTGIVNHADLAGRLVAGYDFIGDIAKSNDGNGRDADASDPGDYGCNGSTSSWHGTHVAGTIGAASNNGVGVAGVNWVSKIQSIRVMGKCGGYTSDIIDGMRWAAGIAVAGTPVNATPARVLNLSLGGTGPCGTSFQNAVNDVVSRGTVVVVAAGNSAVDASNSSPANCTGVIAVAATVRNGGKASYSNFGSKVAIAAPGGGNGSAILSTMNTGSTVPVADSYANYQGTSMAAPHVAGVVSLMLSANPALTPAQVLAKLQSSARAFPVGTGSDCTLALCGAGIVDAAAALAGSTSAPPPPISGRVNLALAANGATLTASSTYGAGYAPSGANDGNRRGKWGAGGGWNDATAGTGPDWLQADFGTLRTVAEIDVFTLQDDYTNPLEPTRDMTFSRYGITDFEVQYWTGSTWQTVPGGSVTGNNKVWRSFTFTPVTTSSVRVLVVNALGGYSRITELEAYSAADQATLAPTPPAPSTSINVALQSNGGSAVASSTYSLNFPVASVNNGDRRGLVWGSGGGWSDATSGDWPDTVQINFNATKNITEIDVFTLQDAYSAPQQPTETLTFTRYGITDFDVQYLNGAVWVTVPGGSVTANNNVWRKFSFASVSTNAIRIVVRGSLAAHSRITEIEAYGTP